MLPPPTLPEFDRAAFLTLLGLFAQTGLAWTFTAIFAFLGYGATGLQQFRIWRWSFAALAIALTALSLRFLPMLGPSQENAGMWGEGEPLTIGFYVIYLLGKSSFCLLLLHGAACIADRPLGASLRACWWGGAALLSCTPLLGLTIEQLMILQAPWITGGAFAAWRRLRPPTAGGEGRGRRLVRVALLALACLWAIYGTAAWQVYLHGSASFLYPVLQFSSHADLVIELLLGCGLITAQLQDVDRRMRDFEVERQRLLVEVNRSEKLRALGTLVSGVAHELNNPLTAIRGYAESLADPAMATEAARVVTEQVDRCSRIVRGLSALAGANRSTAAAVDLPQLIDRVVRGLRPQLAEAAVMVDVDAAPLPPLMADPYGLEQVLGNLLSNALQASPPGARVRLQTRVCGDCVEIDVVDQGPGIPAELRDRVFEPFFTTKAPGKGTGLGLAVAHAIVHSHGGSLKALAAEPPSGACLRVRLPLRPAVAVAAATAPPAPEPAIGEQLLLVDDDRFVRGAVRRFVEARGFAVEESESAEAALALLATGRRFDVVLCDLRMPGIGGIGLHDRLQREQPALLARVAFFTGDLASAEAVAFAARCQQPLLQKPFDFARLVATLRELAASGSRTRASNITG